MTLTNIMADARYKATGSNADTSFADADIKRSINTYLHQVNQIAIQAGGKTLPFGEIVKINTVAGQNEYLLTDTDINLLRTNNVFVKSKTAKSYVQSKPIDVKEIADPEDFMPSTPRHYFLEDSLFIFYSADILECTSGILIYCQTDITELSADADLPQIPEFIVQYVSLGAEADYTHANSLFSKEDRARSQMLALEPMIKTHYARRSDIIPKLLNNFRRPK